MRDVELLAPVGSFEALKAAVQNGANAVYLGGKDFGARASANNFDRDELKEAVKMCIRDRDIEVCERRISETTVKKSLGIFLIGVALFLMGTLIISITCLLYTSMDTKK